MLRSSNDCILVAATSLDERPRVFHLNSKQRRVTIYACSRVPKRGIQPRRQAARRLGERRARGNLGYFDRSGEFTALKVTWEWYRVSPSVPTEDFWLQQAPTTPQGYGTYRPLSRARADRRRARAHGCGVQLPMALPRLVTRSNDGNVRVYVSHLGAHRPAPRTPRLTRGWTEGECQHYLHAESCPPARPGRQRVWGTGGNPSYGYRPAGRTDPAPQAHARDLSHQQTWSCDFCSNRGGATSNMGLCAPTNLP